MAEANIKKSRKKRNSQSCHYPGCPRPVVALKHCRDHLALVSHVYSPALEDGYGPADVDETECFVYVLRAESGPVKVGRAKNVAYRCRVLQGSCPDRLDIVASFQMTEQQAVDVERQAHSRLKRVGAHIRGEWFSVAPDIAVDTVRDVAVANHVRVPLPDND